MRAPTTTDQYMQVIPEGVASTLNSISGQLRGKKAAVKGSRAAASRSKKKEHEDLASGRSGKNTNPQI
jgi:hypothetical protein